MPTYNGHHPCAFLDRDGTVIAEKNYLRDPAAVELLPGSVAGLQGLRNLGYRLVILTNQSGVGRGYFRQADVDAVHARLAALLAADNIRLDGIYSCPHRPEDRCACRKPATGLVERATAELDLDPATSVMIGDKACDIELGARCGMTRILVQTGHGATQSCDPDVAVADLAAAAAWLAARASSAVVVSAQRRVAQDPAEPLATPRQ
jgi:histidinol-phosphate phosphatase family protein